MDNSTNGSSFSLRQGHVHVSSSGYVDEEECRPQCALSSDPGYVLYSAIGSFFAPMLVMIFFNWRIYITAKKTTQAIRQGYTKVKRDGRYIGGLGVHRGQRKANLIKVNINGNFQSEYELVNKRGSILPVLILSCQLNQWVLQIHIIERIPFLVKASQERRWMIPNKVFQTFLLISSCSYIPLSFIQCNIHLAYRA